MIFKHWSQGGRFVQSKMFTELQPDLQRVGDDRISGDIANFEGKLCREEGSEGEP